MIPVNPELLVFVGILLGVLGSIFVWFLFGSAQGLTGPSSSDATQGSFTTWSWTAFDSPIDETEALPPDAPTKTRDRQAYAEGWGDRGDAIRLTISAGRPVR